MEVGVESDELEWSEEEDPERYIMKPPPNDMVRQRESTEEAEEVEREPVLFDHKRSAMFSGVVPIRKAEIADKQQAAETKDIASLFLGRLEVRGNLIPIEALHSPNCIELLRSLFGVRFDVGAWKKALSGYEMDDFLSVEYLLDILVALFGRGALSVQLPHDGSAHNAGNQRSSICVCASSACSSGIPLCQPTTPMKEASDESGLSALESFRIEVVFSRLVLELHGKVRVRHVTAILNELGIRFEKAKLPKSFWMSCGDLIVPTAQDMQKLIAQIKIVAEEQPDPLDHLFAYRLPKWLREEFKVSEILLYQHHFTIIDQDGGGSIDVHELQNLFASLGSRISLDQAQQLIDEYDLDGGGTIDFVEFIILIYKVQRGTIDLEDNGLARMLNEAKAQLRIFEEIEQVTLHPPDRCTITSFGGSPVTCDALILGSAGSPYDGCQLRVQITFHDGYPYVSPDVQVLTRIISVNIMMQLTGAGRAMHLQEVWEPDWSISKLLVHVTGLLAHPQPDLLPDRFRSVLEHWEREVTRILAERTLTETEFNERMLMNGEDEWERQQRAREQEGQADLDAKPDKENASPSVLDGSPSNAEHAPSASALNRKNGTPVQATVEDSHTTLAHAPLTLEAITSPAVRQKILDLPRVEQMHMSVLFLYATDKPSFFSYAREIARRYSLAQ